MKYMKYAPIVMIVFGLVLLGAVISPGNSQTGKFFVPVLMIALGIIFYMQGRKRESK